MSKIVSLARFANSLNETANTTVIENISLGDSISEKVPPGVVFSFAVETPPAGWLICDGSAISRTTYSKLFSVIGETWGTGDGSTTFNLPDLRGEFLRGFDGERGVDTGRSFGSLQSDEVKSHTHTGTLPSGTNWFQRYSSSGTWPSEKTGNNRSGSTDATGGTETRPRNIAVQYCIKY